MHEFEFEYFNIFLVDHFGLGSIAFMGTNKKYCIVNRFTRLKVAVISRFNHARLFSQPCENRTEREKKINKISKIYVHWIVRRSETELLCSKTMWNMLVNASYILQLSKYCYYFFQIFIRFFFTTNRIIHIFRMYRGNFSRKMNKIELYLMRFLRIFFQFNNFSLRFFSVKVQKIRILQRLSFKKHSYLSFRTTYGKRVK